MAKSREGFTVHIKLSGKKNGTAIAVVKIAAALEKNKKTGANQDSIRVLLAAPCPSTLCKLWKLYCC